MQNRPAGDQPPPTAEDRRLQILINIIYIFTGRNTQKSPIWLRPCPRSSRSKSERYRPSRASSSSRRACCAVLRTRRASRARVAQQRTPCLVSSTRGARARAQALEECRSTQRGRGAQLVGRQLPPAHRRRCRTCVRALPPPAPLLHRRAARRPRRASAARGGGRRWRRRHGRAPDADLHAFWTHQVHVRANAD
jgi:hypothetical protein